MKSPHILVLAPEFPAINQPWMDTYLEQLQKHGATFEICSYNNSPTQYHRKVDDNGWRRLVHLPAKHHGQLLTAALFALSHPLQIYKLFRRAVKISSELETTGIAQLKAIVKSFYFAKFSNDISKPDIIHGHAEVMSYEFLHLSLLTGIPLVVTFHGPPPPGVANLSSDKRRLLYRLASGVLVNTQFAVDMVENLGCSREKVSIIPQGLPLSDFPFAEARPLPADGELQLLTVSRLQRDKGHRYVLMALRRLSDMGISAHYHIVGSGPEFNYLVTLAKRLNVSNQVTFHGGVDSDQLCELYKASQVFVLASCVVGQIATETQGVALLEALASGCLVVACAVGGIPETAGTDSGTVLVQQRSSRAIANAVAALAEKPESWEEIQRAGRNRIETLYSADVIGNRVFDYLCDKTTNPTPPEKDAPS